MANKTPQIPIIIGVADIKNPSLAPADTLEPLALMLRATQAALKDTGLTGFFAEELQSSIDSVSVVETWSWPYADLPGLLATKLGVQPTHKHYSERGGHQPAKLVDEAARRIMKGESAVAVVTGGEALASLKSCLQKNQFPPPGWTKLNQPYKPLLDRSQAGTGIGAVHGIGLPIHVYPLYENAFRAHRGQSIEENNSESARLYAEFARVAQGNEVSWKYGETAATAEDIGTVSKRNRMVCWPYPVLMNAFNYVNLAAAVVLTSVELAREMGVPQEKWVYPLGGAGTRDSVDFWNRPNFHSSPAISRSLDASLAISGLTRDDIDLFDLYSCFPIVPKLACQHLGFPIINSPKPLTLLGGLTSFGGAGNNYSMHAITALTRRLRTAGSREKFQHGLVLANGGVLTYQHALVLSSRPRADGKPYPTRPPLPEVVGDVEAPKVVTTVEKAGKGVVETYTVEFNRDNTPLRGYIIGRLKDGSRFVANHGDDATLRELGSSLTEQIGRNGWVRNESGTGRNLFSFESGRGVRL